VLLAPGICAARTLAHGHMLPSLGKPCVLRLETSIYTVYLYIYIAIYLRISLSLSLSLSMTIYRPITASGLRTNKPLLPFVIDKDTQLMCRLLWYTDTIILCARLSALPRATDD